MIDKSIGKAEEAKKIGEFNRKVKKICDKAFEKQNRDIFAIYNDRWDIWKGQKVNLFGFRVENLLWNEVTSYEVGRIIPKYNGGKINKLGIVSFHPDYIEAFRKASKQIDAELKANDLDIEVVLDCRTRNIE